MIIKININIKIKIKMKMKEKIKNEKLKKKKMSMFLKGMEREYMFLPVIWTLVGYKDEEEEIV